MLAEKRFEVVLIWVLATTHKHHWKYNIMIMNYKYITPMLMTVGDQINRHNKSEEVDENMMLLLCSRKCASPGISGGSLKLPTDIHNAAADRRSLFASLFGLPIIEERN